MPPGPEKNDARRMVCFAAISSGRSSSTRRGNGRRTLTGRSPAYAIEYRVQHDDGSWHWVRARGLCVRDADGQPLRIAGSVSDIDAQRRAEDRLRESEERYVIAMTGSNEGHWVWDLATDELFVSPMMREMFESAARAAVHDTRTAFLRADQRSIPTIVGELAKAG